MINIVEKIQCAIRDIASLSRTQIPKVVINDIEYIGFQGGRESSNLRNLIKKTSSSYFTLTREIIYQLVGDRLIVIAKESDNLNHEFIGADIFKWKYSKNIGWVIHEELIVVDPIYRGRGIATNMRHHAVDYFRNVNGLIGITTYIYSDNKASLQSALNAGWSILYESDASDNMRPNRKKYLLILEFN